MIYQKIGKIVRKGLRCHRGMITPPCHHFHFSLRRENFFPAQVVIFPWAGSGKGLPIYNKVNSDIYLTLSLMIIAYFNFLTEVNDCDLFHQLEIFHYLCKRKKKKCHDGSVGRATHS